jgi:hypothetical protein
MSGEYEDLTWLSRLSAAEWMSAARNELAQCQDTLSRRAYRAGVTHARRAAGMALNAVLRSRLAASPAEVQKWGRSYMEHLSAVACDPEVPRGVQQAAELLITTKPAPPELVHVGRADTRALDAASQVIAWAELAAVVPQ